MFSFNLTPPPPYIVVFLFFFKKNDWLIKLFIRFTGVTVVDELRQVWTLHHTVVFSPKATHLQIQPKAKSNVNFLKMSQDSLNFSCF